jgi:hypothetical protein
LLLAGLNKANSEKAAIQAQADRDKAALQAQVTALQSQVSGLQSGVPDAVAAIAKQGNLTNLVNLVLNPARQNWTCGGDVFIGQTFVDYSFNRPPYC